MNYATTFSAILDVRSYDTSVLGLEDALTYEILERNLIGEPQGKTGKNVWAENRLVFAVRPGVNGHVESVVAEVTDRVNALPEPALAAFRNCTPWLIVRLLDPRFIELHFDQDIVARLAAVGVAVSIENRT